MLAVAGEQRQVSYLYLVINNSLVYFENLTQAVNKLGELQGQVLDIKTFVERDKLSLMLLVKQPLVGALVPATQKQAAKMIYQTLIIRNHEFVDTKTEFTDLDAEFKIKFVQSVEKGLVLTVFQNEKNQVFAAAFSGERQLQMQSLNAVQEVGRILNLEVDEVKITARDDHQVFDQLCNVNAYFTEPLDKAFMEFFYCTDVYSNKEQSIASKQIVQLNLHIVTETQFSVIYFAHEFEKIKGAIQSNVQNQAIFGQLQQIFEENNIIKKLQFVQSERTYTLNIVNQIYNCNQRLSEVVTFSCLRYKELYEILEFFVKKQIFEIESGRQNLLGNIRPISELCQFIIQQSGVLLRNYFSLFQQIEEQNAQVNQQVVVEFEKVSNLIQIVQSTVRSAVEVMRIFAGSRVTLLDLKNVAKLAEQNGLIFLGISKLLSSLSKSNFKREMLQFALPAAANDHDARGREFLYSKENGFYQVGDFLHTDVMPELDGVVIAEDQDSCIGAVLQFLKTCQFFSCTRPDGKITVYDILKLLIECQNFLGAPTSGQQILEESLHLFRSIFNVLNIVLVYIMFIYEKTPTIIMNYLEETTANPLEIYLIGKILYVVDFGFQSNIRYQDIYADEQRISNLLQSDDYAFQQLLLVGALVLVQHDKDVHCLSQSQQKDFQCLVYQSLKLLPLCLQNSSNTELSAQHWAARISQLALIKHQYELALGLSRFAPQRVIRSSTVVQWRQYSQVNSWELTTRCLLVKFWATGDSEALVRALQILRFYLNSKAQSENSDCQVNRRMASLYVSLALNLVQTDKHFVSAQDKQNLNVSQNKLVSQLLISTSVLTKSGYDLGSSQKFIHGGQKLVAALINYQKISDVERRLITTFCVYENQYLSYVLIMLFKQDRSLAMQLYAFLKDLKNKGQLKETPGLSKAFSHIEQQKQNIPQFLLNRPQNLMSSQAFCSGEELLSDLKAFQPEIINDELFSPGFEIEEDLVESQMFTIQVNSTKTGANIGLAKSALIQPDISNADFGGNMSVNNVEKQGFQNLTLGLDKQPGLQQQLIPQQVNLPKYQYQAQLQFGNNQNLGGVQGANFPQGPYRSPPPGGRIDQAGQQYTAKAMQQLQQLEQQLNIKPQPSRPVPVGGIRGNKAYELKMKNLREKQEASAAELKKEQLRGGIQRGAVQQQPVKQAYQPSAYGQANYQPYQNNQYNTNQNNTYNAYNQNTTYQPKVTAQNAYPAYNQPAVTQNTYQPSKPYQPYGVTTAVNMNAPAAQAPKPWQNQNRPAAQVTPAAKPWQRPTAANPPPTTFNNMAYNPPAPTTGAAPRFNPINEPSQPFATANPNPPRFNAVNDVSPQQQQYAQYGANILKNNFAGRMGNNVQVNMQVNSHNAYEQNDVQVQQAAPARKAVAFNIM